MLVPLSWLKEYVDIDVTPEELEKKLFDGGFEVEAPGREPGIFRRCARCLHRSRSAWCRVLLHLPGTHEDGSPGSARSSPPARQQHC